MGKRTMTVVVAVLVTAALGVGGVLVASRSGQREPAALSGLQVEGAQDAVTAESAADAQAAPRQAAPGPASYQVRGKLPELASSGSLPRTW